MDNGLSVEPGDPKPISHFCQQARLMPDTHPGKITQHRVCPGTTVCGPSLPTGVLYTDGVAPKGGASRLGTTHMCHCECHGVRVSKG